MFDFILGQLIKILKVKWKTSARGTWVLQAVIFIVNLLFMFVCKSKLCVKLIHNINSELVLTEIILLKAQHLLFEAKK